MVTRKATLADLAALSILFDDYRKFYRKASDMAAAAIFLKERMINEESEIFIVEDNKQVLMGFVQLYPLFSSTRMKRLWLLNDLFIQQEYRSTGASKLLIDEGKNLCRRTNSCGMILETAKDNTIGNSLYLKTGFLPDNDHNYYEWDTYPT